MTGMIPQDLIDQYARGRMLLFVGQGINSQEWWRWAEGLKSPLSEQEVEDSSPPDIADAFADAFGVQSLIQYTLDFYNRSLTPLSAHVLLARLTKCNTFVTVCPDERLEQAFREIGRSLDIIVRHVDRSYGRSSDAARLYKLHGTLSQPDTLVLTTQQVLRSYYDGQSLSDTLKGQLAENTILFVGHDLADPFFQQLYLSSIAPLDRHEPRSYAFGGEYSARVRRFCEHHNIRVIKTSLVEFLQLFLSQAIEGERSEVLTRSSRTTILPQRRPYRYLSAYQLEDRDIFFGRDNETERLVSLIHAHRVVVVHGNSGVGKSSLLSAGALPILQMGDYDVIVNRMLLSPTEAIREQLTDLMSGNVQPDMNVPLVELLTRVVQARHRPLVIVLDQFEQFIARSSVELRKQFARELGQVLERREVPIKWVLILRSDYLAMLGEFRDSLPEILRVIFGLTPLTWEDARQAITGPAFVVHMSVESRLVDQLLKDLDPEQSGKIEPAQLQIVCDAVYDVVLQRGDELMSLALYEQIGGAQRLLRDYLNLVLNRMTPFEATGARRVLTSLVSSNRTLNTLTMSEIAATTSLSEATVQSILHILENERLVKEVLRSGEPPGFELTHSYLISTLDIDPQILEQKALEESFKRDIDDWEWFGALLSIPKLRLLRQREGQIAFDAASQKLLIHSVLLHGYEINYWMPHIAPEILTNVVHSYLIQGCLVKPQSMNAIAAVPFMENREALEPLLRYIVMDPTVETSTRQQAIASLAQINPEATVEFLRHAPARHLGRQALVQLNNLIQSGKVSLKWSPTLSEQLAIIGNRLKNNLDYMLSRTGVGGLGALIGGLLVGLLLLGTIDDYVLFILGSLVVSFIWGAALTGGISLAEALSGNRGLASAIIGGGVGGFVCVLPALDTRPEAMQLGLVFGSLAGVLGGCSLAITFYLARSLDYPKCLAVGALGGLTAGLLSSLPTSLLIATSSISGLTFWHVASIMSAAGLGLSAILQLTPLPPFTRP